MGTNSVAVGRSARGMTLLEVLAAVFCLGMGLIMVAGAFPAGAHQTRLTIEQTDASMMAASAMEHYINEERVVQKVSQSEWKGLTSSAVAMTVPLDFKEWCVWNPERLPYMENWVESKMLPPGGGDFVMRGFLTRVSGCDEPPLFRMTVVVCRYSNDAPDMYDVTYADSANPSTTDNKYPPGVRYQTIKSIDSTNKVLTVNSVPSKSYTPKYVTDDHYVSPGDMVMDTSTGFCYPVAVSGVVYGGDKTITLGETVLGTPAVGRDWFIFRNVIGVYYRLVN